MRGSYQLLRRANAVQEIITTNQIIENLVMNDPEQIKIKIKEDFFDKFSIPSDESGRFHPKHKHI